MKMGVKQFHQLINAYYSADREFRKPSMLLYNFETFLGFHRCIPWTPKARVLMEAELITISHKLKDAGLDSRFSETLCWRVHYATYLLQMSGDFRRAHAKLSPDIETLTGPVNDEAMDICGSETSNRFHLSCAYHILKTVIHLWNGDDTGACQRFEELEPYIGIVPDPPINLIQILRLHDKVISISCSEQLAAIALRFEHIDKSDCQLDFGLDEDY